MITEHPRNVPAVNGLVTASVPAVSLTGMKSIFEPVVLFVNCGMI